MTAKRGRWKPILTAGLAAIAVACLGALSTDLGGWYRSLVQPAWKPPDALFGPAWTTIYLLAAIAGVRVWQRSPPGAAHERMIGLFAFNAFVNVLWSLLFFRMRRPDWALFEVGFLWLSIVLLIVFMARYSKLSAWLLAPYLAWVSFASALNAAIVNTNGPFGAG